MKRNILDIIILIALVLATTTVAFAQTETSNAPMVEIDTTGTLRYPFYNDGSFDYPDDNDVSPLYLNRPSNIKTSIEYDPLTGEYVIEEKVGNIQYRMPKTMQLKEYVKYDFDRAVRDYWRTRTNTENIEVQQSGLIPQLRIESEAFTNIFGSEVIDIRPQGYVEVQFGVESRYNGNETLPERMRRVTSFDFENQINMSVRGKIGDKVNLNFNYNTEATFDFDNEMTLDYTGKEDEIIRRIEAGNVSLPLNGSLIQGGTNLFGIKTEMQFGKLNVTTVISQHKGESQVIETEGGAQTTRRELKASDYDANRHFFISKYFRENYNNALSMLPVIRTQAVVNKVEVWITNKTQEFVSARDIVAFVDLGEPQQVISNSVPEFAGTGMDNPGNSANGMYSTLVNNYAQVRESDQVNNTMQTFQSYGFENGRDWEKIDQARKLDNTDYTFNPQLGFISLNSPLNNDEVLAIAYEYTLNGEVFQVGEFTSNGIDSEKSLILKMLKGTNLSPGMPTWDLMMKNIYNTGGYNLTANGFDLHVTYYNDSTTTHINYLPESELRDTVLLRLMNLDNLNSQNDYTANGDGVFDFIDNITVNSQNGRVIFPVLEPFGANIANNISNQAYREKYAYTSLYEKTKTEAEQDADHDKYRIVVSYKGASGSEISVGAFNLAEGSVKVTAGGRQLVEDVDYVVDYASGNVKIINEGLIEAGTPIQVSTENKELISTQRKTMIGSYANYMFSDKFNIGATALFMNERPITNKVDMDEEPVSNLMLGLDFQYRERSRLLTDIVNLLPFYESDVESSMSVEGEVAKLITGKSGATDNQIYIDDFEGVETPYSYLNPYGWNLASTPQKQPGLFPEGELIDNLAYGYNRARLAWYFIDREVFVESGRSAMPSHIKSDPDARSNHYARSVSVNEIFPGKEIPIGQPNYITTLDLAYFPWEKGPYNFDSDGEAGISSGVDSNNKLLEPESRWAGMMRDLQITNFETSNIEYIEFWLLDPFIYDEGTHDGGDLYFNLGNISEDILKDSRKAFENGLPVGTIENVDTTVWGRVSTKTQLGLSFENSTESRQYQDLGLNGLNDVDEASFYADYIAKMETLLTPEALDDVMADPANDNFDYYRGSHHDANEHSLFERYKKYNSPQNNSPTQAMSTEEYTTVGKTDPDVEDINGDNTLSELEAYYQYKVSIRPEDLQIGKNYVVDKVAASVKLPNQETETVNWYQFKIPVREEGEFEKYGDISGFSSIRFMRMFLTNFSDSVIMRFGSLGLIRSDWREVTDVLADKRVAESANAQFEKTSVNIEENGSKSPVNYVLPPGIDRERDPSSTTVVELNEQSMLLKVKDLEAGDARAVYKTIGVDLRQYKHLRMAVHAEEIPDYPLDDYQMSVFVRLGKDKDNYYEYEIPLKLTAPPATKYNNDSEADRYLVWPQENELFVELDRFPELKLERNEQARQAGATVSIRDVFEKIDNESINGKNILRIKGNPTLADIDRVYIGLRNPYSETPSYRSVEVWVNELRVSDYDQKGGWASSGRMSLRLADLGSVSLTGQTQSVGWGSVSQSASQRSLEERRQFSLATTAELGKLLPEKIGLNMPLFYSYSTSVSNPEYSQLDTDVKMDDAIDALESPEEKEKLLDLSQDVVTRKSLNINNISVTPARKKADRKSLPTDIENFSLSYSKNEQLSHNVDVEKYLQRNEKGVFNYNYSMRSTIITPLKKVNFLKGKAFALIRDFNFSLLPELISFRTDLTRSYNERTMRDNTGLGFSLPTTVQKDFLWNRYFDLRWKLSNSLSIDFTNQNIARIDELEGVMDKDLYPDEYEEMMGEIYDNIKAFGRPVDYQHRINVNYRIPINKLPLLDWTSATATYSGTYDWMAGSKVRDEGIELGNTVGNNMNARLNGQLNFLTLYNKVPYLKEVNSRFQSQRRQYGSRARERQQQQSAKREGDEPKRIKDVNYSDKKVSFRADVPKSIFHRLGTEDVDVVVLNERGDTIKGELTIVDLNRVNFKPEVSIREARVEVTGKKEIDELFVEKALAFSTRLLMGVRSVRVTYNQTGATQLPGFLPEPYLFGMRNDESTGNMLAPTIPFLLGWQDEDFVFTAAENDWITVDNTIQKQYMLQNSETWNFSVQVEPISNVRIDFTGTRRESNNISSYINYNEADELFELQSRKETGNFDMTILTLRTAFKERLSGNEKVSELFDEFRYKNRQVIANRFNQQRGWNENQGYSKREGETVNGVSLNSTEVIIPALLAAYTGTDASKISLKTRPGLASIRPNWRVNYNGNPQQVEWMKDIIYSLNFSHSYKSTYTIGRYETNLAYAPDENGLSWVRDELDGTSFIPELAITSINIQEAFNPLINVDIGFVNDLSTRFEIRRTRNFNFDFTANQLSEMIKNEYTVGLGYRFTGLDMIIKTRNNRQEVSNDLNLRFDLTSSDYKNVLRKMDVEDGELTGGTKVLSMNFNADYMLSDKLTVKLYYQYNMTNPYNTLNGYMQSNTKFGLSFNFAIL
ncbi:MAG: cell surface protein SprA [Prolixibacteraceae bacterium]|nr:cell surface protein SprA [Prolixibacteraceae bacterium]MBN2649312.1 cell surface protein SprA [Prolixibacteraceae bacterium]